MAELGRYLLQLEDRGEFVSRHPSLQAAQDASVEALGALRWQDHPRGKQGAFSVVFKNTTLMHPVSVSYSVADRTVWIWYDPT